jgi:hypothetical protein
MHLCQTVKIHPIASEFDKNYTGSKSSLADAITDRVMHRKDRLLDLLKEIQGSAWVISDEELKNAADNIILLDIIFLIISAWFCRIF